VIIFDWDDTLLPTTYLIPYQNLIIQSPSIPLPNEIFKKCHEIDLIVKKLLILAKENGKVMIITNAADGWVELSAQRFLPKTFEVLRTDIEIVSARSKFERELPGQYHEWKARAFLEVT
jgi:hypothetical protein